MNGHSARETIAWWVAGVFLAMTVALTAVIVLGIPESLVPWSGLGMLAWVALAAPTCAWFAARAGFDRFWPLTLRISATLGWIVILMCAPRWRLLFFQPNSSMFTMLFPVTGPIVFRPLFRGGRTNPVQAPRIALWTICLIAVAHLAWFFTSAAPATRLFLAALAVVSFLATRCASPVRSTPPPGAAAEPMDAGV